jgi:hypothetical protein
MGASFGCERPRVDLALLRDYQKRLATIIISNCDLWGNLFINQSFSKEINIL